MNINIYKQKSKGFLLLFGKLLKCFGPRDLGDFRFSISHNLEIYKIWFDTGFGPRLLEEYMDVCMGLRNTCNLALRSDARAPLMGLIHPALPNGHHGGGTS
ncbi:hypothetical protein FOCC_FOCC001768, partial [Frankliniella occidentalis]